VIPDARDISDYALYRRRFALTLFLAVLHAGLFVLNVTDQSRDEALRIFLSASYEIAAFAFTFCAGFEFRRMREARPTSVDGERA
jgi:hypothetical protein